MSVVAENVGPGRQLGDGISLSTSCTFLHSMHCHVGHHNLNKIASSPIRITQLLPELLIRHQCNVLMLHLYSFPPFIHPPDRVNHLHYSVPQCYRSLAAGSPGLHMCHVMDGCYTIVRCCVVPFPSHYYTVGLTVIDTPAKPNNKGTNALPAFSKHSVE